MQPRNPNLLDYIYNLWCVIWLVGIFLMLFPFMYVCIRIKRLNWLGTKLTNFWADGFFFISGLWVKVEYRFRPRKDEQYIFVANHFSFLDIAVGMKIIRNYFSYMGKASVKKVPLLGYLFAKLHIQVDRSDKNSRMTSVRRSKEALRSGRSLFIMPEGGILSEDIPNMRLPFKDGAFALAIESNTAIVPISYLNLWRIMPSSFIFWDFPKVIIHPPIFPGGKSIDELKEAVYQIIQNDLDRYGNRYRND